VVDELNVIDWDDPQLKSDATDGHGHGTHMTSIIAQHAPRADYVIVRVADDGGCTTTWHVMAGLAAVPDCQVVNISIASSPQATHFACASLSDELVSVNLAAIVRDVCARDAVLVAAAGNKALAHLAYPARVGECLAVASVNAKFELSSFSNYGATDHAGNPHLAVFVGPGGDEQNLHGAVTELVGTDTATGTRPYFGTSYATAYATAAVALYRADHPADDRSQTLAALASSADRAFTGYTNQSHGNGLIRLV
jgi:subtilisin family serine protease